MKTKLLTLILATLTILSAAATSFESDTIKTKTGDLLILQFIKHASLSITCKGKNIQIDPVGKYADYSSFPKADLILITHEHGDHLDAKAVADLLKKETVIVANKASQAILGKGIAIKNGEKLTPLSFLHLEAVPAYNTTPGREKFHPKGRDNGYILSIGGLRIYVAGDTENIPEMSDLQNIDIAFLPVNQPYTMTVEQAIDAAKTIRPRILYPYHFGDSKVTEIKEVLKQQLPKTDVRIRQMQ